MLTGLKALLSAARDKSKPTEGSRSPRDDNSQHGSGSSPTVDEFGVRGSPERGPELDSLNQVRALTGGLSAEEFDELMFRLQRERVQASMNKEVGVSNPPADQKYEQPPETEKSVSRQLDQELFHDGRDEMWRNSTSEEYSRRTPHTDDKTVRMATRPTDIEEKTSPKTVPRQSGIVEKIKDERVKLDTLIKNMNAKGLELTGPSNYEEWIRGLKEVGKYRKWNKDYFDLKSENELKYLIVDENDPARQEAYLTVESTVSKDVKYIMGSVPFAHVEEAIAKYADKYGAVTALQKGMLQKDLWMMTQESTGLDIGAFIAKIEVESRRCREAGHPITDDTMVAVLLNGMLPDFNAIKGSLSIGVDYIKNFSLTSSVVSNYAKDNGLSMKRAKAKSRVEGGIAYVANGKTCYYWKTYGKCAKGDDCPFKESHGKINISAKETTCYSCGKKGHYARDCRSRDKQPEVKKKSVAMSVQEEEEEDVEVNDDATESKSKLKSGKADKGSRFMLPMLLSVAHAEGVIKVDSVGLDTCASSHLWNNIDDFIPGSLRSVNMTFVVGDSDDMPVKLAGDILASQGVDGEVMMFTSVGYAPKIPMNLISFGRLAKAGIKAKHSSDGKSIKLSKDGFGLMEAQLRNDVFMIDGLMVHRSEGRCLATLSSRDGSDSEGNYKKSQFLVTPDEASKSGLLAPSPADDQKLPAEKVLENCPGIEVRREIIAINVSGNEEDIMNDLATGDDLSELLGDTEEEVEKHSVPGVAELSLMDVHLRFGHVNVATCLRIMGLPPPDKDTARIECDACEREKQSKQSLPDVAQTRARLPLYRVHVDSSGKRSETEGGNRYYVVMVDDASRKGWLMLTATKDEIPARLLMKLKQLTTQRPGLKLAFMRFDGAGEYKQQEFEEAIIGMGGSFETSAPYRQAQNGIAEARVGMVSRMARAMMTHSSSSHPKSDWGYAVMHANMLINMIPTKANNGLSPNEVWGDPRSRLPIPGPLFCAGYAKVYKRGKMESEAIKVVYMGNAEDYKAFLVRPLEGPSNAVHATRDATFFASQMPYSHPLVRQVASAPIESDEEDLEDNQTTSELGMKPSVVEEKYRDEKVIMPEKQEPQGELIEAAEVPRGYSPGSEVFTVDRQEKTGRWQVYKATVDSNRSDGTWLKFRNDKNAYGGYTPEVDVFTSKGKAEKLLKSTEKANPVIEKGSIFATIGMEEKESLARQLEKDPSTREQMLRSDHRDGFVDGEHTELETLMMQKVYELVEMTNTMNVLDCKWVYKAKRHPTSGEIKKYRSRLVAKGFKERHGIEYTETFSSNVKMEVVRLLFAIAAYYDLDILAFDIKAYFLYGVMDNEHVYMHQPDGYCEGPARGEPGYKVCRLLKAIYGTKQAQRCADKILIKALMDEGIKPTASDSSLYYARDGDKILICGMYVDDGLCVTNDKEFAKGKIKALKKVFELEVTEDPKIFVGIQIERDRAKGTMLLHQEDAVIKLLAMSGMFDCKPAVTPMQVGLVLTDPSTISTTREDRMYPYQSIVGQLLWLLGTRIDLCFAINVLTRYMSNWNDEAITLVKRVIRYLKGKEKLGLMYRKAAGGDKLEDADQQPTKMVFMADCDYAGRVHDSKCTGGGMSGYGGNTVYFQTKTHPIGVSTSTSQAEGLTCKLVCHGVEWTSALLGEINIRGSGPIVLYQDNQSVISLSANPINHKRSKHYRIAMHYVRDLVVREVVKITYLNTECMTADILTKALAEGRFKALLKLANFGAFD